MFARLHNNAWAITRGMKIQKRPWENKEGIHNVSIIKNVHSVNSDKLFWIAFWAEI